MKTISLWQPWATAIALGLKRIETRHWETNVRGPIAIHAAKRATRAERKEFDFFLRDLGFGVAFAAAGYTDFSDLPFGAIVCTCELVACDSTNVLKPTPAEFVWGNYAPDRFGWSLANVVKLPVPIPCVGRQGFFDWNAGEVAPVRELEPEFFGQ